MSEVQPQSGDKAVCVGDTIEVTRVETGKVERITEGWIYFRDADGSTCAVSTPDSSASIRVVERADDPSRDEIGTIRGSHGGASYIRLTQEGDKDWWSLHEFRWVHSVTAGAEPVTGAVPSTPAAQVKVTVSEHRTSCPCGYGCDYDQEQDSCSASCRCDEPQPLVVQYGDPEPADRDKFVTAIGGRCERVNGTWADWRPWSDIPKNWFPLREVVGP